MNSSKTYLFVVIQFLCIFLIIIPFSPLENLLLGSIVTFFGLGIGVMAIQKNRLGNFNIRPDIKDNCHLITEGIYAYVRHPMYTSVLLSALGVSIIYNEMFHWMIFGILSINMVLKLLHEEKLWHCHDAQYLKYSQKTKRLVPFIF